MGICTDVYLFIRLLRGGKAVTLRKMKAAIALLLFAATICKADISLSANQVFCNCGEAENEFYHNFSEAESACSGQAHGAGYGSCMAIHLGFLSEDCRTHNPTGGCLGGHDEFHDACVVEPFPDSVNATEGWQWPGAYPYAAMDAAFDSFLDCVKSNMINFCHQVALDNFHQC